LNRTDAAGEHDWRSASSFKEETPSMVPAKQSGTGLSTRHSVLTLIVWLVAMVIAYAITTIRIDRLRDRIRQSGIEITTQLSEGVSLPLLAEDVQAIHTLLLDAAKRSGVIYASVIDHQERVLAFAGAENFLPDMPGAARSIDKVWMWEGRFENYAKILHVASEINYSGTKIGEILVGLSVTEASRIRNQFIIVAVVSGLILSSLIVILRFRSLGFTQWRFRDLNRVNPATPPNLEKSRVTCPLCGTQKPFFDKVFNPSNLDRLLIIEASEHESGSGKPPASKGLNLSQLAKREDLSWMRRQVILRCTEIIRKLAA
jgi:hypothetical protein